MLDEKGLMEKVKSLGVGEKVTNKFPAALALSRRLHVIQAWSAQPRSEAYSGLVSIPR